VRVIHVVPSASEEASGVSYAVVRLCQSLTENGAHAQVASLRWTDGAPPPCVTTFRMGIGPRRLGMSPRLRRWLERGAASGACEVIHSHGLWMMPNVYTGRVCRQHRQCRLVVSPHGMLSAWALGRRALRKRMFWHFLQHPALRSAACFHATSESEYEDIRRLGFTQPICLLPIGVDAPLFEQTSGINRRLLFLSRIHPAKGVDTLLQAWSAVQSRFAEWELHIVGPDEGGYLARMERLAAELRLERVVFRGPLYGDDKLRAYREATLFVLPSRSENFGIAVAEALAAGTPAIATVAAPWSGLVPQGAGWWIDTGVDPLVRCLEEALALPSEDLAHMGVAARRWMLRDYAWPAIGQRCLTTYRWLVDGGETPPWVRLH
jgi:glycosyltransferase involved in cell wall biosynthesis